MATDIDAIVRELSAFYSFENRSVVHVGAGGGQLIGYAGAARRVLAVDVDPAAVERLRLALAGTPLEAIVAVEVGAFESIRAEADVVLFEFCLHEIADPAAALAKARSIAPDTVVIDHLPDSRWAWHTVETEKAARAWEAVHRAGARRVERREAVQRFADADALEQRVAIQGDEAVRRARTLAPIAPIEIGMSYGLALV